MNSPGEAVSLVPETPTPDRSWLEEAIAVPRVPLKALLKDNLTPAGLAIGYNVGQLCLAMVDNCESLQQIPYGAEAALPSAAHKYGGILKVIREYRSLSSGFSPFANLGSSGDQEEFDAQTRRMKNEALYTGNSAKLNVQFDDDEQLTRLVRTVGYYDVAPSKKQLGGIPSNLVRSVNSMPVYATLLLPHVRVGTPYKYGPRGTSQVISAEIIQPGDNKQRNKSRVRRSIRLPALNILPKPALDCH